MKKLFLISLNIILISFYNVAFRYFNVQNSLDTFNRNSTVVSGFMTTSSTSEPYLKIFALSFILTIVYYLIMALIIKQKNNSFLKVASKRSIYMPLAITIISTILLYLSTAISFIFLIIGLIIFMYYIYRDFNLKKDIYILLLLTVLYMLVFYFISF